MKTLINNLDTILTIDTYSMFTAESFFENEEEHYRTEEGKEVVDWVIDHKQVVTELANESIGYLENELRDLGIIKTISLVSTHSPKFYNYTTDSYKMQVDFNVKALMDWFNKSEDKDLAEEIIDNLKEDWQHQEYSKYEPHLVTLIDVLVDIDSYHSHMWEAEYEIYCNNSKPIFK